MRFDIITLFPKVFEPYLNESILGRAVRKGIIKIKIYNLREFSSDRKHHKVDDRVYGGGPGMVLQVGPIIKAVEHIRKQSKKDKIKLILFSPKGKQFDDKIAKQLAGQYDRIILICGHYEGVDERVKKILRVEELSVGPYVLSGGELPAMILTDAVARKIKGVLGKEESLEEKRYGIGIPVYTRPEIFIYKGKRYKVPKVLKSGDHSKISEWRSLHRKTGKS